MFNKITKYNMAFALLDVQMSEKAKTIIKKLEREGHTEKSICFSIHKDMDKLIKFKNDSRFWNIFENSVRHWSWPKNDKRWDEYNKQKRAAQ